MFTFFKKSILRKVFLYFFFFALVLAGSVYYLNANNYEHIPLYVCVIALASFLIYFLLVYLMEIVRPINIILDQMKSLLAGKKYSKIYTKRLDEIGVVAHFFNEVTKSFEKVSIDIKEGKRMLSELEIASQLQKDILPPLNPSIPGLEIVAKNRPAVELGGDNFDFITKDNNTYIYVGDVTGHGVPAALVMTMVNTLIHTLVEVYDNAYDVLVNTNHQLKDRIKSTMFMTLLMLRWDHMAMKMTYVGCGHEHLLIYRADIGKCEIRKSGGIALGMVPDNSKLIKEEPMILNENDLIILYTDGLTEGRNMAGEMYTLEKLIESVERFASEYGPDGVVNHVALDYSRFVENHVQDDDVTLIAVQYVGTNHKENMGLVSTSWSADQTVEKQKVAEKQVTSEI